ncbi:MAG: 4-hydroxy-tetrahydrodipicolinate synthase [Pseudopedobacter saltans]|uniref:4-hydroxy-tetrahydrodipicolinate synthase n=1 Tax=Pseudopedobacter saltans TaxID=151895 RepID=A0A2W5F4C8_9SPHI|nr:MAG: 4-hydroxy-tetrahydrodipicolinate synthase [Pseudopedobacter saltans]
MNIRQALKGTGVAIVTPFNEDLSVDFDSLGTLIDHLVNSGVNYIVTLGTTGETPTLSKEEKIKIINYTIDKVNNRIPVVVGVGGNNTLNVIEELKTLPLDKATAILSTAPYYNKPSQEGFYQHYKALADVAPKPILLYNVPGRTGKNIEPETTLRLAKHPNIVGIKEASNNFAQSIRLLIERPDDFLVVSGDDDLAMPQVAAGMDGVISVAANAFPKEFSQMIQYALDNNAKDAAKINLQLFDAYLLMFAENNPAGVKSFLTQQGLIKNYLRLPLVPLSEPFAEKIKAYLKK